MILIRVNTYNVYSIDNSKKCGERQSQQRGTRRELSAHPPTQGNPSDDGSEQRLNESLGTEVWDSQQAGQHQQT